MWEGGLYLGLPQWLAVAAVGSRDGAGGYGVSHQGDSATEQGSNEVRSTERKSKRRCSSAHGKVLPRSTPLLHAAAAAAAAELHLPLSPCPSSTRIC